MEWSGSFYIGNAFAVYIGASDANDMHKHVAYQLIICRSGIAEVTKESGEKIIGKAILIKPLIPHSINSESTLTLVYLEPQSDLVSKLRINTGKASVETLAGDSLPFDPFLKTEELIHSLIDLANKESCDIDKRILLAMELLGKTPGSSSVSVVAKKCALSESHLRTLVRKQLGVPLATWVLWRKLQATANELRSGATLADSAVVGGFADQAHFTRTLRRMFGITPSIALNSLGQKD
jgi:AraC-like DNA-binding protein